MAFKLIEKEWNPDAGEYKLVYILDSVSDVAKLPASPAGSKAYAPASAKKYVATTSGGWYEVQLPVGPCGDLDTTDATATDADMASGKTAYVNGVKVTGTIEALGSGYVANNFDGFGETEEHFRLSTHFDTRKIIEANRVFAIQEYKHKFGDATAEDVRAGKTFTSAAGLKVVGTWDGN